MIDCKKKIFFAINSKKDVPLPKFNVKFKPMKKLLFLTLSMSMLLTTQAGYVIRGISVNNPDFNNLMNYTLTIDGSDSPIAAGTMHTSGYDGGRNSIVIIDANNSIASVFLIPYYDIEVRDFHRVTENKYILCGSRRITDSDVCAFVAVVTNGFMSMDFYEYPDATMFYSICVNTLTSDYYVCGTHKEEGVIASIDRTSMLLTNFYVTTTPWEYHKIIATGNTVEALRFVASGRNPDCFLVGFTAIDPSFSTIDSYEWRQNTEPDSHCVVGDYIGEDNTVIVASSYRSAVILNPVTFPLPATMQVSVYRFYPFAIGTDIRLYVQDIGTIQLDPDDLHISVAGWNSQHMAWHGYTIGLSGASTMTNNYYYDINKQYEHYKIRYDQIGKEYTGGYYQDDVSTCALFGSPLTPAPTCDHHVTSPTPDIDHLNWTSFNVAPVDTEFPSYLIPSYFQEEMNVEIVCSLFKSGEAPESAMPSPETESDIIALQDRITLKDVPFNTNYQIYSVIGQLIQTGTTTPDISTAQLGKGVYILRLENGKTFKFVK